MDTCAFVCTCSRAGITKIVVKEAPGKPQMYVYSSSDIVSQSLLQAGTWESKDMSEIEWAMKQHQVAPGAHTTGLFVDVGANIGWFTINMASRGYRVAAVEGKSVYVNLSILWIWMGALLISQHLVCSIAF